MTPPAGSTSKDKVADDSTPRKGEGMSTTPESEGTASAQGETKEATPGEAVVADDFRDESEGVKTPIKSDFANSESPVSYDPAGTLVGPAEPQPVSVAPGETAAMHEAHVQLSGGPVIAERLEREAEGEETGDVASDQARRALKTEFQRVDGATPLTEEAVAERDRLLAADESQTTKRESQTARR